MADFMDVPHTVLYLLFTRLFHPSYHRLSLNITREISTYIPLPILLPRIKDSSLTVYDLTLGTKTPSDLPFQATPSTHSCLLTWSSILVFLTEPNRLRSVDLIDFTVKNLTPMSTFRENSGVICVSGVCYSFGGCINSVFTCISEKYTLKRDEWSALPALPTSKFGFNPGYYAQEIYLADVNHKTHSFDIFTLNSEIYRSISFDIHCSSNGCVSFIVKDALYLLTMQRQGLKWDLKRLEAEPERDGKEFKNRTSAVSVCTPRVYGSGVYWVDYGSLANIVKFDLNTEQVIERVEISSNIGN